jgi:N,N'-diacetylchitobiose transport system permease protein
VRRNRGRKIALNATALGVFAVMIFPVYWMVATGFKRGQDIFSDPPVWFPWHPTLSNFTDAVHHAHFWASVKNSIVIAVAVVLLSMVLAFLAALALAKFGFYGRRAFIVLIIAVQMIPLTALIIPIFLVLSKADQVDKLSGVIVTYLTFVLPFTIWTLRGFVGGVPLELEEAARVDGASRLGAFMRVTFPLVAPGLVATGIFAFILAWNEFIFALVIMNKPQSQTMPVWLQAFNEGARGTDWGGVMAGSTVMALPVVIFFLIVQRKVTAGLTAGAVKG